MLELQFKNRERDPVPLVNPGLTIGGDRISGIIINETGVEGFHADLRVDGDTLLIEDVGTGLGTFVNGQRIGGSAPLQVGDEVGIGDVVLVVAELGSAAAVTANGALQDTPFRDGPLLDADWALRAESGPLEGKVFSITGPTKVGRALQCDISIPEGRLSREHAELSIESNQLVVRDLKSSNGTYHNGNRVQRAALNHGDVLSLDTLNFRVIGPAIESDATIIGIRPERIGEDSIPDNVPGAAEGNRPEASARSRAAWHFPMWGVVVLGLIAIAGAAYYYLVFV